jgi:predicted TIM-barrel fold metal-dependent hydrolase
MQIIDAQIHLWTNNQASPHHWRAPYTIDMALRDMLEAGVNAVINHPPFWDAGANEYAVEAATLRPDKFATLGWFPLDETASEPRVDEWLSKPGMLGLRFIVAMPDIAAKLESGQLDWLWSAANARELPMGVFATPAQLPLIGEIASRYPKMRLLIDHLSVFPGIQLPDAANHFETLADLSRWPNIAVKSTAVPSMATDGYPFTSTHDALRRIFDAYGSERMFWGSDITRLQCTWRECVESFTEGLNWLKGRDLENVMGGGVRNWIGWHPSEARIRK